VELQTVMGGDIEILMGHCPHFFHPLHHGPLQHIL
jgi:hypothetical protein